MLEKLDELVGQLKEEYGKFEGGNKSAGTRSRKLCQDIKTACQELRIVIQDKKNA